MAKVNEFNWKEMISSSNGKTSGMLLICLIAGLVGCYTFTTSTTILIGAYI